MRQQLCWYDPVVYRTPPIDKFEAFAASIANLAGDEARKAKLLYLRNGLAEHEASLEHSRSFGMLQLAFAVIPLFWPILYLQRRAMITDARLGHRRIQNALEIWRTELGDDGPLLTTELERLRGKEPGLFPWSRPSGQRQLGG